MQITNDISIATPLVYGFVCHVKVKTLSCECLYEWVLLHSLCAHLSARPTVKPYLSSYISGLCFVQDAKKNWLTTASSSPGAPTTTPPGQTWISILSASSRRAFSVRFCFLLSQLLTCLMCLCKKYIFILKFLYKIRKRLLCCECCVSWIY